MSHQLGLDGVLEKLILLEHFAFGSQQYCQARRVGSEEDQDDGGIDDYWGWLKAILSSHLIECAVRVRMLQDAVAEYDDEKMADLEEAAKENPAIGTVVEGRFALSIRETCNKIIHASNVLPELEIATSGDVEYKYWDGDCRLSGTKGPEAWEMVLHVAPWARAVAEFIEAAEAEESHSLNIGQDWYGE